VEYGDSAMLNTDGISIHRTFSSLGLIAHARPTYFVGQTSPAQPFLSPPYEILLLNYGCLIFFSLYIERIVLKIIKNSSFPEVDKLKNAIFSHFQNEKGEKKMGEISKTWAKSIFFRSDHGTKML
jgi:hypothetical protein